MRGRDRLHWDATSPTRLVIEWGGSQYDRSLAPVCGCSATRFNDEALESVPARDREEMDGAQQKRWEDARAWGETAQREVGR